MSKDQKPEPKQFSLTVHEANMLRFVQNHQGAIFAGLLSTIAVSRLGYTTTPNTQFQLSGDMAQLTIIELEPPEEAKADSGSPVVTAPENKTEEKVDEQSNTDTSASDPASVSSESAANADVHVPETPTAEQLEAEESLNKEIAADNKANGFNADGSKIDVPEPQPVTPAS